MLMSMKYKGITIAINLALLALIVMSSECLANNDSCCLPEGVLQIAIFGSDDSRLATWHNNTINFQEKNFGYYESTNRYKSLSDQQSSYDLPQQLSDAHYRFDIPYAKSFDNSFLITSVYPDREVLEPTQEVALLNLIDKKLIGSIKFKKSVLSVLWSPSARSVAILLREDMTGKKIPSPSDLLGKILGHPISYYNLSVAVYSQNGQFACERNIATKIRLGSGYIVEWKSK